MPADRLCAEEGALQVGVVDEVPVGLGHVEHVLLDVRPGVVDQNVDPAVARDHGVDSSPDGPDGADVQLVNGRVSAEGADVVCQALELGRGA